MRIRHTYELLAIIIRKRLASIRESSTILNKYDQIINLSNETNENENGAKIIVWPTTSVPAAVEWKSVYEINNKNLMVFKYETGLGTWRSIG